MNRFVDQSFAETVHRLAVGFEPHDPYLGSRLAHPVRIDVEGAEPWRPRHPGEPHGPGNARRRWRRTRAEVDRIYPRDLGPRIDRHDSGRHVLLIDRGPAGDDRPAAGDVLDLRLYDHSRRYVPRRLRLVLAAMPQVRRPMLFPGAAYDFTPRTTGLRGRAMRGQEPVRWVRVEARRPGDDLVIGRAHGDDRGEFLLILSAEASPFVELTDPLEIEVEVFAPPATEPPGQDPFGDLPVEVLGAADAPDPVATGESLPPDYASTPTSTRVVPFRLGRTISSADGVTDFVF